MLTGTQLLQLIIGGLLAATGPIVIAVLVRRGQRPTHTQPAVTPRGVAGVRTWGRPQSPRLHERVDADTAPIFADEDWGRRPRIQPQYRQAIRGDRP
jgi:hypothetical protein